MEFPIIDSKKPFILTEYLELAAMNRISSTPIGVPWVL
jgi:hypothetical protein